MSDTAPTKSHTTEDFLRVSATSVPKDLGAAIAHAIYDTRQVHVQAVGAGAVNQAVKGIAIARGHTAPRGLDLYCIPAFVTVPSKDGDISVIRFTVFVA
jgi:stage V sporulation protein S